MKRLLFVVLVIVLAGCDALMPPAYKSLEGSMSAEDAFVYVVTNYQYLRETDRSQDHWQSVEETMELGTGDCEDLAFIFLFYAGKGEAVAVQIWGSAYYRNDEGRWELRPIVLGQHMIARVDGVYYDPSTGESWDTWPTPYWTRLWTYKYDDLSRYF